MERLIDPVIADMQCEHEQASRRGRPWERRWTLVQGYLAFWEVLALHAPVAWTRRVMREWAASDHWAVGRALGSAAVTMLMLTTLFIAMTLQTLPSHERMPWLLFLFLPQSLPQSLPLSLLVGVVYGLRDRPLTIPIRRAILMIGLAGSLASLGAIAWLVPAANQAYVETIAGGHAQMSLGSLREHALAIKRYGRLDQAGGLLFSYHARWALAGAALAFALFGLGVTALRAGRAATAGIAAIACVVYVTYFFELSYVRSAVFSDEHIALGLAWLPNILLILASMIFLSADQEPDLPDQRRAAMGTND